MADSKSISQLTLAEQTSANDLYEVSVPNAMTSSGYISRKVTANEIGLLLNTVLQYSNALQTDAKTIVGAINEAAQSGGGGGGYKEVTGTLEAGQTSITLTDTSITTDSTFDYYTDVFGVNPVSVNVVTGQITLTFDEQESDIGVKVRVS